MTDQLRDVLTRMADRAEPGGTRPDAVGRAASLPGAREPSSPPPSASRVFALVRPASASSAMRNSAAPPSGRRPRTARARASRPTSAASSVTAGCRSETRPRRRAGLRGDRQPDRRVRRHRRRRRLPPARPARLRRVRCTTTDRGAADRAWSVVEPVARWDQAGLRLARARCPRSPGRSTARAAAASGILDLDSGQVEDDAPSDPASAGRVPRGHRQRAGFPVGPGALRTCGGRADGRLPHRTTWCGAWPAPVEGRMAEHPGAQRTRRAPTTRPPSGGTAHVGRTTRARGDASTSRAQTPARPDLTGWTG